MTPPKLLTMALVLTLLMSAALTATTGAASSSTTRTLTNRGTTTFTTTPPSTSRSQSTPSLRSQHANRSAARSAGPRAAGSLTPPVVASTPVDNNKPGLTNGFEGLNEYDSQAANNFPLEPPDQGLCAGRGYILETINDVLQVYNTSGGGLTTATALNTFFNEDPTVIQLSDPSCYFDHDTQRWFQIVLGYAVDISGNLTGPNHIDIAVSKTADPTAAYNLYSFPVQDDGTDGTPVHPNCPCLGDYPHLGADKYGFYVTTNEYSDSVGGPNFGFNTAQLYAMSKQALAQGFASPKVTQFDNLIVTGAGTPGFTLWPATAPSGANYATGNNGTEYFLSSMATGEANTFTGFDNRLGVWALTNTQALQGGSGSPVLSSTTVNVETYGIPQLSEQKFGPTPLANCLNDSTCATNLFGATDPHHEVEGKLDSNDSRMQQTTYVAGKLYGALDTIAQVNGATKAGIAYFVLQPTVSSFGMPVVSAPIVKQGYLATANNNVNYPTIGVTTGGKALMSFTLVGTNYYPSQAYTSLDAERGTGKIHIAAAGVGPDDGLTQYQFFVGRNYPPRWGDYGAAAVDGQQIYVGNEYIAQRCILAQFKNDPTCGGTRDKYANWSTRISSITP